MLIGTIPTTLLQIFYKVLFDLKVIGKRILGTDVNF